MDCFKYTRDKNGYYSLLLSKKLYSKEAILNSCYVYSKIAYFKLELADEEHVAVIIRFKNNISSETVASFMDEFCNEVVDQQIRLDLEIRTSEIRNMIYEKAFLPIRMNR